MLLCSCYKSPTPVTELTDAHKKLEQLLPKDYNINAVIKYFPNTLYIYIPLDFDILKTKASSPDPFSKPQAGSKRHINFAETTFENSQINVQYDISTINTYPKELGYTSAYTDQFSKIHNNILGALTRSYGDLTDNQKPMDFVVLMIIDINNGIGVKSLFHLKDLQMTMTQALSQDEYAKRSMTEMIGNDNFIGNKKGIKLNLNDISWPEFIAKQITHRINFKYGRSNFPPTEGDTKEILSIIYDTIHAYDFEDFEKVQLENLSNGEILLFDKGQLETFKN